MNLYINLKSEIIIPISWGQNKSKIHIGITIIKTLDKFSILLQIIIENILNKDNILSPSKAGFSKGIWNHKSSIYALLIGKVASVKEKVYLNM